VGSSAGSNKTLILDAAARGDGVSAAALQLQRCEQGVALASDAISGLQ
jgi:hypothetical protein